MGKFFPLSQIRSPRLENSENSENGTGLRPVKSCENLPIQRTKLSFANNPSDFISRRNTLIAMMEAAEFCDRYDRAIVHNLTLGLAPPRYLVLIANSGWNQGPFCGTS